MILDIVYKFLLEKKKAKFEDIFSHVRLLLESKWVRNFGEDVSIETIITKKMGELFGYLNTDGRFIMLEDKEWSLTHNFSYSKIAKLRAIIIEDKNN